MVEAAKYKYQRQAVSSPGQFIHQDTLIMAKEYLRNEMAKMNKMWGARFDEFIDCYTKLYENEELESLLPSSMALKWTFHT